MRKCTIYSKWTLGSEKETRIYTFLISWNYKPKNISKFQIFGKLFLLLRNFKKILICQMIVSLNWYTLQKQFSTFCVFREFSACLVVMASCSVWVEVVNNLWLNLQLLSMVIRFGRYRLLKDTTSYLSDSSLRIWWNSAQTKTFLSHLFLLITKSSMRFSLKISIIY